jgi:hypothetical protein
MHLQLAAAAGSSATAQIVQVVGALLILAAFAASQFGAMSIESRAYLVLNILGSLILAVLAAATSQWGFLLLETVWAIVSAYSLVQVLRGRAPAGAGQ